MICLQTKPNKSLDASRDSVFRMKAFVIQSWRYRPAVNSDVRLPLIGWVMFLIKFEDCEELLLTARHANVICPSKIALMVCFSEMKFGVLYGNSNRQDYKIFGFTRVFDSCFILKIS